MEEERNVGARESPAQRVAATIETMPPVAPSTQVLAQQFSKLLVRSPHTGDGQDIPDARLEAPRWDGLRKSGFRLAEKLLSAAGFFVRQGVGRQGQPRDGAEADPENAAGENTHRRTGHQYPNNRRAILRLGINLFSDEAASELATELAECARHARHFGTCWRVEVILSNADLPATRLLIHCDESALHLHFSCGDPRAQTILENNVMLLRARLAAVSARPVTVEIVQATAWVLGDQT